ncbi:unnamed protein product [Porites lobata]|uniref:Reverse transcriptase domain-containing protein n=1 Tax=Porites lobata TaxID=104759 RepID=A0ABN8P9Q2_9CNID|nr:unnamed protein product [Porites lobata]
MKCYKRLIHKQFVPVSGLCGPHHLLFIIYINDFPKCLRHTTPGMFADDTYITTSHEDISTIECSFIQ